MVNLDGEIGDAPHADRLGVRGQLTTQGVALSEAQCSSILRGSRRMVANSEVTLWRTAVASRHRNGPAPGCVPASRYARIGRSAAHQGGSVTETPISPATPARSHPNPLTAAVSSSPVPLVPQSLAPSVPQSLSPYVPVFLSSPPALSKAVHLAPNSFFF